MNFFDLHSDTLTTALNSNQCLDINTLAVDFTKAKEIKKWHQCFAVFINDNCENPFNYYQKSVSFYKSQIKNAPANLTPYLTVENGTVLEGNIDRVEDLKNDGVRALTLTWNGENELGFGARLKGDLKPFGEKVISRLNEYKIFCDLSHINDESFYSALNIAKYPFASHSCCEYVTPNNRNLDDNQIKALALKGGIIGICFYPPFCKNDVFEGVYLNILHLIKLGVEDYISVGSDFDGCDLPNEISNISKVKNLYDFLINKNIPSEKLDKIFFKNAENFFKKAEELN